jgi:transcriptional regulator with AAA-type ATPase domain
MYPCGAQVTADETDSITNGEEAASSPARGPVVERIGVVQIFPRSLEGPPRAWPVAGTLKIGRRSECAIHLDGDRVSRQHALVSVATDSSLRVVDLSSRHGTFVNGVRTGDTLVSPGSIVRCGDSLLLVVRDVGAYSITHRLTREYLGTPRDVWGGPALFRVWQRATYAAELQDPVLLLGESGSGKEAVARLIHATRSPRGPFVAINLAAIQANLFESELFGHVRGAFTGAGRSRLGAFREAAGGVLFLDEVGDLAPDLQVKLLRAIEEKRVRPIGSSQDFPCDARVVSATSRDLSEAAHFRSDLRYRLSGIVIEVPALRTRPDDVLLLALAALRESAPGTELSVEAAESLSLAAWPGNVRELQNVLVQATMELRQSGAKTLEREHFAFNSVAQLTARQGDPLTLTPDSVRAAMARAHGNASRAAKVLGVSRATLYNFCGRHGLALAAVRAQLLSEHDPRDAEAG